jgi:hypothetical protein
MKTMSLKVILYILLIVYTILLIPEQITSHIELNVIVKFLALAGVLVLGYKLLFKDLKMRIIGIKGVWNKKGKFHFLNLLILLFLGLKSVSHEDVLISKILYSFLFLTGIVLAMTIELEKKTKAGLKNSFCIK